MKQTLNSRKMGRGNRLPQTVPTQRTISLAAAVGAKVVAVGLAITAVAGCQTVEERTSDINSRVNARLASVEGLTMAEFSEKTGVLPSNSYDDGEGRVFVVEGPTCRLLFKTMAVDGRGTAASWRIHSGSYFGGCDFLA